MRHNARLLEPFEMIFCKRRHILRISAAAVNITLQRFCLGGDGGAV